MSVNALQPPSYEDAMRESGNYAVPSAPMLSSPEHEFKGELFQQPNKPMQMPMPTPMQMPMPTPTPIPPITDGAPADSMGHVQPLGVPPQGQMPMYVMPPTNTATTTTVYMSPPPVGPNPCTLTCPVCHQRVRTTTTVSHTGTAHVICLLMCFLGCCCCSCLPYCMSGFKITKHECPSCKSFLGAYKP